MTTYTYYPKGTCSKQMEVDLEDGVIKDVRVPRPALHRAGKGAGERKRRKVNPTGSKELTWMEKEKT